jgi:hypothetical protein
MTVGVIVGRRRRAVNADAGQAGRGDALRPGLTRAGPGAYITPAIGRMAEWLCNGLQIRPQRFDSASGLQSRQLFIRACRIAGVRCRPRHDPARRRNRVARAAFFARMAMLFSA